MRNRWVALRVFSALVILACPKPALADEPSLREQADELLRAGKYEGARVLYRQVLAEDPSLRNVWAQLGIAELSLERFDEAAQAFRQAMEHGYAPDTGHYNLACSLALGGHVDEGLDALQEALRLGFANFDLIDRDADLDALRVHDRFAQIVVRPVYRPAPEARSFSFESPEGHRIFGDYYEGASASNAAAASLEDSTPTPPEESKREPILLLFHQSGSNVAEYSTIATRLADRGYHCFAIDARGGGGSYGNTNQTVAAILENGGERGGGSQAVLDFKALKSWVRSRGFEGPIAVWGSSYSAGRVFQLLADHPDEFVAGLAFSPGRAFARSRDGEASWASRVQAPVFVTCPESEYDEAWQARADAIASGDRVVFVQEGGRHGSSTLRSDRNPDGFEENWGAVLSFLDKYVPATTAIRYR